MKIYKSAFERMRVERINAQNRGEPEKKIVARLEVQAQKDPRCYNVPTATELAVIIQDTTNPGEPQDILLQLQSGHLT